MNVRFLVVTIAAVMLTHSGMAATAAEPLDVPAILPITGPAAFRGKEFQDTLKLLETTVNKTGGIKGRTIHFVFQDDQSSPQVAVQLTNVAIATKPLLILNGGPLAMCAAAASLVKDGPLMYCLSSSMPAVAGSFTFSVMSSSRDCLIAGMNYFKARGFKKIGILNATDATGGDADTILADIIKLPEYAGMSYAGYEHFNLPDLSVAAQISRIKAAGAQAIIAYTTGTQVATVLHGLVDAGLDVPVFTSNGNMSVAQLDGYKSFMPKELLFPGYPALAVDPVGDAGVAQKIAEFRDDMKGGNMTADLLHAIPWDPGFLIVEALKGAPASATPAQLRDALSSVTNWPGALGRYDFKVIPNRGLGLRALVVSKWDPARSTWVVASKTGS
jgi:branched-chain amino acid transport system substrate-binding protein